MGCLTLKLTPARQATVAVKPCGESRVVVTPGRLPSVAVTPSKMATVTVTPEPQPRVSLALQQPARLTVGEVCTVSGGELLVLASTDGPLRTRDGGFLLLDPALEQS